ncbi:hypothetical protein VNI00_008876 [Paramarasmius palmivorus]|uniref:DUF6593 domain-containing protein n=1 Tax=Paramarasmius palmivorus TaxID=297713 RepID=A0AAW0AXQ8_9AGAR
MELLLSAHDTRATRFTLSTGQALYETKTPEPDVKHPKTISIKKLEKKGVERDMAFIEFHKLHDDVCRVWGTDVQPKKEGLFTSSSEKSFTASDGNKYIWNIESPGCAELQNASGTPIAVSSKAPLSLQIKLSIEDPGLVILDEIVATFVVADQWARMTDAGFDDPVLFKSIKYCLL